MDSDVKNLFFFESPQSRYSVVPHFRQQLMRAFQKKGIFCHDLGGSKDPFALLKSLKETSPDFTIAFNGLLPSSTGTFLSDQVRIPHLALLVDFPTSYVQLTQSSHTVIACPDQKACQFLKHSTSFDRSFFLPHAVEEELILAPGEKDLGLVFFSSFIDPGAILKNWLTLFPENLFELLTRVAKFALKETDKPFWEIFASLLDENLHQPNPINLNQYNVLEILYQLENYIRACDKLTLLRSLHPLTIHLYGEGWENWAAPYSHLALHPSVNFEEAIAIMKRSKIVLNSCPSFRYGGHERIFYGLACGAAILTQSNPFLREWFRDQSEILYVDRAAPEKLTEIVAAYLQDENLRQNLVDKGQKVVRQHHTWDHRAEAILAHMAPYL